MISAIFQIQDENENDALLLSELAGEAFGPGRFARTAYRIREGVQAVPSLSLTGRLDGRLVGGIRFTAVTVGAEGGALLLGPLVVHPAHKGKGYGQALAGEGLARARAQGFRLVVLSATCRITAGSGSCPCAGTGHAAGAGRSQAAARARA